MSERGVSDLVGYILVFSLVAMSVGIISISGLDSLQTARSVEQVNNAERALDVLADNMEDIYREGAPSRASEVNLEEASFQTVDQATINVSGVNANGVLVFSLERQSNLLVWGGQGERDTELRYVFGTVVRDQRAGGRVVRDAPFDFGEDRTILPIVQTRTRDPQSFAGGTIRIRGVRETPIVVFRGNTSLWDHLYLNVTTPAPEIWQAYLDDHDQVDCAIEAVPDPDQSKVRCDYATEELFVVLQPVDVVLER